MIKAKVAGISSGAVFGVALFHFLGYFSFLPASFPFLIRIALMISVYFLLPASLAFGLNEFLAKHFGKEKLAYISATLQWLTDLKENEIPDLMDFRNVREDYLKKMSQS